MFTFYFYVYIYFWAYICFLQKNWKFYTFLEEFSAKTLISSQYPTQKGKFLKSIETVAHRCSVKKVFLEISQNSLENTCARVSI